MEYIDPDHKRTLFTAESFAAAGDGATRRLLFSGHGHHRSVIILERGPDIVATVPELEGEFVLRKIQVMEKLKWLTLDFKEDPRLRRIVIEIDRLKVDMLDAALKSLLGPRSLPYYRDREEEPNQSSQPSRAFGPRR